MSLCSSSHCATLVGYRSPASPSANYDPTGDCKSFDPEELTRLLRARTPTEDDMTARYEELAKRDYDRLIEMGGRPTRPIRLQPVWSAIYKNGLIYVIGEEGELECTLSDDTDPMNHHWLSEYVQFTEELEKWQSFKECQQKFQHEKRRETQLELDNSDAELIKVLIKLSDWQEFEIFQERIRVNALDFEDRRLQEFEEIIPWDVTAYTNSAAHGALRTWLRGLDRSQELLESANDQLNWIKDQWPKVLAEAIHSLRKRPELQPKLEAKFRKQTHGAFSAIEELGGRPSHTVSQPDGAMDGLQRTLYWSSETSKYMEELLDWKTFLTWRLHTLGDSAAIERREYRCPHFDSALDFFAQFEKFRLFQYNLALTWLKVWQRAVRWHEEEIKTPDPDFPFITQEYLERRAGAAQLHVRDSEQKLADAATRLEKATKEHAHARSEHGQITRGESEAEFPQKSFPATPPLSISESSRSSRSPHFSRSSSSPPQCSQSSSTAPSSHSSLSLRSSSSPPQSSQSPASLPPSKSSQTPQSLGRLFKDRKPSSKRNPAETRDRRAKKKNARKSGAKVDNANTNIRQDILPSFSSVLHAVEQDDDVQMMDTSEDPRSVDITEELGGAEPEDIVTTDLQDPFTHSSPCSLDSHPKPITNINTKSGKLLSPMMQGQISRRTRSATKLDQSLSGGVPKNTKKKPSTKVKAFTEQQTMALLNAAAMHGSPPDPPFLRRSERLKEKAAASANISSSQQNVAQISHSSGQKQPQKVSGPVGKTPPSRQKKPKLEHTPLRSSQSIGPQKPKMEYNVVESARSRRQKKLGKRARDAARLG